MDINEDVKITGIKVLNVEETGELVSRLIKEKEAYKKLCGELITNLWDNCMDETAEYFQGRYEKIGE